MSFSYCLPRVYIPSTLQCNATEHSLLKFIKETFFLFFFFNVKTHKSGLEDMIKMWFDINRRKRRKSILRKLIKTNVLWFTREEIMDEKLNMIQQCNTVTKRQMLYQIALIAISCKTSKLIFQQWQFSTLLVKPEIRKTPVFWVQFLHKKLYQAHKRTKTNTKKSWLIWMVIHG